MLETNVFCERVRKTLSQSWNAGLLARIVKNIDEHVKAEL